MSPNRIAWAATLAAAMLVAAGPAGAETVRYAIDPSHTFVNFEALHLGTSTLRGRFDRKQGRISLDRAQRSGRAEITIEMDSVDTGVAALDARLKGAEFFDAATHPTASFVAERFGFDGDQLGDIAGTLTLRGRSQPVTLKALRFNCYLNPIYQREVCGGDFETTLARSRWGIARDLPDIADDIRLLVQVEAIRQ